MSLRGKVALVTGASTGIGTGYALQLADAGAKVYITARTKERKPGQPGMSMAEVVEESRRRGGWMEAIKCDHSKEGDIISVFDKIEMKDGRIDILVNNCFPSGLLYNGKIGEPFWQWATDTLSIMAGPGLNAHYVASTLAARMMVKQKSGLIVTTTDLSDEEAEEMRRNEDVTGHPDFYYETGMASSVVKAGIDRMTRIMAMDLRPYNVVVVGLQPGFVLTQHLKIFKEKIESGKWEESEAGFVECLRPWFSTGVPSSVEYPGRAVVALATDATAIKYTGKLLQNDTLAKHYNYSTN